MGGGVHLAGLDSASGSIGPPDPEMLSKEGCVAYEALPVNPQGGPPAPSSTLVRVRVMVRVSPAFPLFLVRLPGPRPGFAIVGGGQAHPPGRRRLLLRGPDLRPGPYPLFPTEGIDRDPRGCGA